MTDIDLGFLARHVERMLSELANIRGELRVGHARLTSIEVAIDGLSRQLERMNDRICKVEDAQ